MDIPQFNGKPLDTYALHYLATVDAPHYCEWRETLPDNWRDGIPYSALTPYANGPYVMMPYSSGGDYSNSGIVERSNYLVLLEEYPEIAIPVYGGYGSYAILIPLAFWCDGLTETLEHLEQYPVLSDDAMSHLESELEFDSWDSWLCSDFTSALETAGYPNVDTLEDDALRTLLHDGMEYANTYYIHEAGCSVYVDVDAIVLALMEAS